MGHPKVENCVSLGELHVAEAMRPVLLGIGILRLRRNFASLVPAPLRMTEVARNDRLLRKAVVFL